MSLLIVVLTSGVSIMRSDVSPGGANSALLAFHYEQVPHNEAHTLTGVLEQSNTWNEEVLDRCSKCAPLGARECLRSPEIGP